MNAAELDKKFAAALRAFREAPDEARDLRVEKQTHRLLEHLQDAIELVNEGALLAARGEVLGAIFILNNFHKRGTP